MSANSRDRIQQDGQTLAIATIPAKQPYLDKPTESDTHKVPNIGIFCVIRVFCVFKAFFEQAKKTEPEGSVFLCLTDQV